MSHRDALATPRTVSDFHFHALAKCHAALEVSSTRAVYARFPRGFLRGPARLHFHLLIYVRSGQFTQVVDDQTFSFSPGTVLNVVPGQVYKFNVESRWSGTVIAFLPEFLQPLASPAHRDLQMVRMLEGLPTSIALRQQDVPLIVENIRRLASDSIRAAPQEAVRALLQAELQELLVRLRLSHDGSGSESSSRSPASRAGRFDAFKKAVESHFQKRHAVAEYAALLGCSGKSIREATHHVAGINAKAVISERIALEAKRLLVHTDMSISAIADALGFGETTNFIKFFRKDEKITPRSYRRLHRHGVN
jgi:AraC-like DNA-binding protein